MINVEIDDRAILNALRNLQRAGANLRPALAEIGEQLVESTKKRFETSTAPDGSAWEENSASTLGISADDEDEIKAIIQSHFIASFE